MSYCTDCGRPAAEGDHSNCEQRAQATDPPRFCTACGRKLVVQVLPTSYKAACMKCGEVSER